MTISAETIAQYAPHGNAQLKFVLKMSAYQEDPTTGNIITDVKNQEVVEYLAAMNLQRPNWQGQSGVDDTTYSVSGRLLSPATLDPRITNGSQADATINGYNGRFELIFDLSMDKGHYTDLRQTVEGTFRVVGGP